MSNKSKDRLRDSALITYNADHATYPLTFLTCLYTPGVVFAVLVHAVALVPHVLARVLVAEARERYRVLQEHRVVLEACTAGFSFTLGSRTD